MSWSAIAAMAENRAIGIDGRLPWRSRGDLQHFKLFTQGKTILVGRKTYESLPPLPGRRVIVMSRSRIAGAETVSSLDEVAGDVVVAGGAEIYRLALPSCASLTLTVIHQSPEADTFMPPFEHLFSDRQEICRGPEFSIFEFHK